MNIANVNPSKQSTVLAEDRPPGLSEGPRPRERSLPAGVGASVGVSGKAEQRIVRGHPWVFQTEVSAPVGLEPGALVRVQGPKGHFLGYAFYSSRSEIQLRMLQRTPDLSPQFLQSRLVAALQRRQALSVGDRRGFGNVHRLVHGEADGLPALLVDRYGAYLVIQTLSEAMERLKPRILDLLEELVQPQGILERNDSKLRTLEGLPPRVGVLRGTVPPKIEVEEAGVRLQVDLWNGKKTGLYLDQRENHVAARRYTRGRVLEAFCYTGGFALHVARFADEVLVLDISSDFVEQARQNAFRNDLWNVRAQTTDAQSFLREAAIRGESFDTVILDPPAMAKNKDAAQTARRAYQELNAWAMKILAPGGRLITCSCSNHVHEDDFGAILVAAAAEAAAPMILVEKRSQARDHPVVLGFPESHYLKCFVLERQAS
jgi:23S rRNA (cytosine1962-C5)-methyltransferase